MLDPVPTQGWECLHCGVWRDVPCKNIGPGIPACGQCGKPMTMSKPPLGDYAAASATPPAPVYPGNDPDTVMERVDDDV